MTSPLRTMEGTMSRIRRSRFLAVLVAAVAMVTLGTGSEARADTILLQDNFNDNFLNPALWTTVTGNPGSSIVEQNQRLEITNRAYLNTQQQFDPSALGGLHISGTWTINQGSDLPIVMTRSDDSGTMGDGILFGFYAKDDVVFISQTIAGAGASLASMSLPSNAGEVFNFDIFDDGLNVSFRLTEVGGDGTTGFLSAVSGTHYASNRVVFDNRERVSDFGDFNHTAFLDDVTISAVPESGSLALMVIGTLGVIGGASLRARRTH
jgi:hypothetical protein